MIFTRTCDNTRKMALMLRNLGFDAIPIHGQMAQAKRIGALNKFKAGERSILVATGKIPEHNRLYTLAHVVDVCTSSPALAIQLVSSVTIWIFDAQALEITQVVPKVKEITYVLPKVKLHWSIIGVVMHVTEHSCMCAAQKGKIGINQLLFVQMWQAEGWTFLQWTVWSTMTFPPTPRTTSTEWAEQPELAGALSSVTLVLAHCQRKVSCSVWLLY